MANKLKIDSLSSAKFKSFAKGKDLDQILNHYSKSSSFSKKSEIEDVIADLIGLRALNDLTKSETVALDNVVNDLNTSLKSTQTSKKLETVGISTSEIKKLVGVAEKANKSVVNQTPQNKTVAKTTKTTQPSSVPPKQRVIKKSTNAPVVIVEQRQEKPSDLKESPDYIKVQETVRRVSAPKSGKNSHTATRRSGDQVHEEKMAKVEIERVRADTQREKIFLAKESLLLREKELVLHEKRLLEDIRHRQESEIAESARVTARMLEASNKTLEENEKTFRTTISEKNKSKRISLEKYKAKSMYDYSMSDVGQANMRDKNKTTRSVARSKLKASENSRIKAEIARNTSAARNAIRLKEIEYKYTRDRIRELNRKSKEAKAKRDKFHEGIAGAIHESSPLLGYSYQFANSMFRRGGENKKPDDENKSGMDWATLGLGGLATLGGGSLLGRAGALLGKARGLSGVMGKAKDFVNTRNPAYYRGPNTKPESFASRAATVGKGIGMSALKSTPLLSGVISGGMEYSTSGSATKGVAVGAGALAGAAMGGAFGAMLPIPGGMLIGGIVGGILGEQGMKSIVDKFLGTSDNVFSVKPTPKSLEMFNSNQSSLWVPTENSSGGASAGGGGNVPKASASVAEKQKYMMDYYIKNGLTKEQAAGLVGNFMQESTLKTGAKNINSKESSFGIAQWNAKGSPDRVAEFQKIYGKHIKDATLDEQMQFALHELKTKPYLGLSELKGAKSVEQSTFAFMDKFERPNKKYAHFESRLAYAQQALSNYDKLSSTQSMVDAQEKSNKATPAPVNVVNSQGGATVNNVTTNTVFNAPETDAVIRSQAFVNYAFGRVL